MEELIGNLHIHSTYSDGSGTYTSIAGAAIDAGLDFIILTDHNVLVRDVNQYVRQGDKKVLLLAGEEVHDQNRNPQKNHMLVIGANRELSHYADDPQRLVDEVAINGGSSFLAHPYEYALPLFHEQDITWESWDVMGFTGLELWNGFSEFKTQVRNLPQALFYAFFPEYLPHQPLPQALAKWDELLSHGEKIFAVAGSDSHALKYKAGFLKKIIYPYRYHFSTINNHILINASLTGDVDKDASIIYRAIHYGSSFISNDQVASSRGFAFTVENEDAKVSIGGELDISAGATIRVDIPAKASLRVIHNGKPILQLEECDHVVSTIDAPGAYRVECYRHFLGRRRGWIFSNPIYIRKQPNVKSGF